MPSLLVIDDEELVAKTFAAIAEDEGFDVHVARTEQEARNLLK